MMLYPVTTPQGISYISRGRGHKLPLASRRDVDVVNVSTDLTVLELGGRVLLALLRENDKENEQ